MNEIEKKINEDAIRDLIMNWARAVRTKNLMEYSLTTLLKYLCLMFHPRCNQSE